MLFQNSAVLLILLYVQKQCVASYIAEKSEFIEPKLRVKRAWNANFFYGQWDRLTDGTMYNCELTTCPEISIEEKSKYMMASTTFTPNCAKCSLKMNCYLIDKDGDQAKYSYDVVPNEYGLCNNLEATWNRNSRKPSSSHGKLNLKFGVPKIVWYEEGKLSNVWFKTH